MGKMPGQILYYHEPCEFDSSKPLRTFTLSYDDYRLQIDVAETAERLARVRELQANGHSAYEAWQHVVGEILHDVPMSRLRRKLIGRELAELSAKRRKVKPRPSRFSDAVEGFIDLMDDNAVDEITLERLFDRTDIPINTLKRYRLHEIRTEAVRRANLL